MYAMKVTAKKQDINSSNQNFFMLQKSNMQLNANNPQLMLCINFAKAKF